MTTRRPSAEELARARDILYPFVPDIEWRGNKIDFAAIAKALLAELDAVTAERDEAQKAFNDLWDDHRRKMGQWCASAAKDNGEILRLTAERDALQALRDAPYNTRAKHPALSDDVSEPDAAR